MALHTPTINEENSSDAKANSGTERADVDRLPRARDDGLCQRAQEDREHHLDHPQQPCWKLLPDDDTKAPVRGKPDSSFQDRSLIGRKLSIMMTMGEITVCRPFHLNRPAAEVAKHIAAELEKIEIHGFAAQAMYMGTILYGQGHRFPYVDVPEIRIQDGGVAVREQVMKDPELFAKVMAAAKANDPVSLAAVLAESMKGKDEAMQAALASWAVVQAPEKKSLLDDVFGVGKRSTPVIFSIANSMFGRNTGTIFDALDEVLEGLDNSVRRAQARGEKHPATGPDGKCPECGSSNVLSKGSYATCLDCSWVAWPDYKDNTPDESGVAAGPSTETPEPGVDRISLATDEEAAATADAQPKRTCLGTRPDPPCPDCGGMLSGPDEKATCENCGHIFSIEGRIVQRKDPTPPQPAATTEGSENSTGTV